MTKLNWDESGERFYEAGVDRGVFYPKDGPGVSWNGLISIEEAESTDISELIYVEGLPVKRQHHVDSFTATLEAFTYPNEFDEYDGLRDGMTNQRRKTFGLAYRTLIGNDTHGLDHSYKIHLVYNAIAEPSDKAYSTVSDDTDPTTFSWDISTFAQRIQGATLPSAHLVIDTRMAYSWAIEALETVLYGTEEEWPRLPTPEEVIAIFEDASIVQITDHGDGSWTAEGPDDAVKLIDPTTFEISWSSAVYIDTKSYFVSSL